MVNKTKQIIWVVVHVSKPKDLLPVVFCPGWHHVLVEKRKNERNCREFGWSVGERRCLGETAESDGSRLFAFNWWVATVTSCRLPGVHHDHPHVDWDEESVSDGVGDDDNKWCWWRRRWWYYAIMNITISLYILTMPSLSSMSSSPLSWSWWSSWTWWWHHRIGGGAGVHSQSLARNQSRYKLPPWTLLLMIMRTTRRGGRDVYKNDNVIEYKNENIAVVGKKIFNTNIRYKIFNTKMKIL